MKNLLFVFTLCLGILSCQKYHEEVEFAKDTSMVEATPRSNEDPKRIGITCSGACDGGLRGVYSNGEHYVECTCDDCEMNITFYYENRVVESTLEDAIMQVEFIEDFELYMSSEYPNAEHVITDIEIVNHIDGTSNLFSYHVNGEDDTIMFASYKYKKFTIKCDGSCGCRERFVYSDPPASECTCDDCTMTVTQHQTPGGG